MGLLICAIEKPSNNISIALLKLPYLLDVAAESKHSPVPYSSKHIDEAASNDDDDDYATDAVDEIELPEGDVILNLIC